MILRQLEKEYVYLLCVQCSVMLLINVTRAILMMVRNKKKMS